MRIILHRNSYRLKRVTTFYQTGSRYQSSVSRKHHAIGTPILPSAIDITLKEKLEDLKRMSKKLARINSHDAPCLLKNCFAILKLTFLLRTARHKSDVLVEIDKT